MELRLLLCVILSCLCSAFAIWMAISARIKNSDTESLIWRIQSEDGEERVRNSLNYESVSRRAYSLERRVVALEKKTASETEEKCCAACRPRSYVTLGEGDGKIFVLLPERKKELCKEASKPHKVDEYCVGCNNLIALGGTKPACALDRKCKDYEVEGK